MSSFKEFGLADNILQMLEQQGITEPTEIQERAIPAVLENKDILATSATGSGKTLAFGLGLVEKMSPSGSPQMLVLAPTRELAEQISTVLKPLAKLSKLRVVPIYGGVSFNPQASALHKADIVVATPGRCLDHLTQKTIDLSCVKHVVLDEADRMLDMGFLDDVNKILSQCPKERQNLLFSATLAPEITHLAKKFMKDPIKIAVQQYVDPSKLTQIYYDVTSNLKLSLLAHLLKEDDDTHVMIFSNSRRYTDLIANTLSDNGLKAEAIHGGLSQAERKRILEAFHKKQMRILVCTDVAARGLDIPSISHVYNFDIPNDTKQYVHRVGRTARAGKDGKVVNLIGHRDYDNFSRVMQENRDMIITRVERPYIAQIDTSDDDRRKMGGGNTRKGQGGGRGPRGSSSGSYQRGGPHRSNNRQDGPRKTYGRDGGDNRGRSRSSDSRGSDNRGGDSRGRAPRRDGNRGSFGGRSEGNRSGGQGRFGSDRPRGGNNRGRDSRGSDNRGGDSRGRAPRRNDRQNNR